MRRIKNLPKPKFAPGDKVLCILAVLADGKEKVISDPPRWNGFTWMYAFEGTEHRCGEQHLRKV